MTEAPYPSIRIRFTIERTERELDALIDTGFDGHLVIPAALVPDLPRPVYRGSVQTPSGQVVGVPGYPATIELAEVPGPFQGVAIALGSEFLVGLMSINRIRLTLDHGRRVIAEP